MYQPIEEIIRKYDGEWICLINRKENEHGRTLGGEVWSHAFPHEKMKVYKESESFSGEGGVFFFRAIAHPEKIVHGVTAMYSTYESEREKA